MGFAWLLAAPLLGQSTSGRIIGRVADPTGAVLADVQVTLTNQATSVSRQAQTNGGGDYNFVEVVPGTYRVEFEHAGFKKNSQSGVIVDVNQVVTLNSVLQLGQVQEKHLASRQQVDLPQHPVEQITGFDGPVAQRAFRLRGSRSSRCRRARA